MTVAEARTEPPGPVVYRARDAAGLVLYIGCTKNMRNRLYDHDFDARRFPTHWLNHTATVDIERFESMPDAQVAEFHAIKVERPPYNMAHCRRYWRFIGHEERLRRCFVLAQSRKSSSRPERVA